MINDLIRTKLKEIVELQDIIRKDNLNYNSKRGKTYDFSKYTPPMASLRDVHDGNLSTKKADDKQSNFANKLKNFNKGIKTLEKKYFLNNLGLFCSTTEKVLNSFKSRLFPIKNLVKNSKVSTNTRTSSRTNTRSSNITNRSNTNYTQESKLKLQQEFINEVTADNKYINNKIFLDYFKYQSPSFLVKDLISA